MPRKITKLSTLFRSTDTEEYMQCPPIQTVPTVPSSSTTRNTNQVQSPETPFGTSQPTVEYSPPAAPVENSNLPRPPPPPPPPMLFPPEPPSINGGNKSMTTLQAHLAQQDTVSRKQQQPLSAISIQDLNSVQLRRTSVDKGVLGKSYGTPTRSMSMQCLSSTNETFLNQKIDLIAELKASKDISGIKKLKVERAKIEGRQEKEFYSDVTKQFTAANFVEQVCLQIAIRNTVKTNFWSFYRFRTRTVRVTWYPIGNGKCLLRKPRKKHAKNLRNGFKERRRIVAFLRFRNGNAIYWLGGKRPNIN